ncbi:DUF6941 family protein [Corynebacterium lipophiloflavum]|uniref:Uncharacterized protein n=1 Tax=Corynebacterium lipophiloflavum (strain ATCC 700352 / DSM 44291 / CCUG 37336 / JCM 10383 / DMMZ 1944) TaxID=525263 RepID=C0XTX6_CORLD|nr:hypothetical protein [Corynebacterium lipophiloflavum]EEI16310.1 hypothetical protein HMPREF0298_1896 [Corynebacterium lipophiloflavum DSM 44291]
MAAELDYAFLAEYAKTESGTLTSVGASFTEVQGQSYPAMMELSVAGRVRRAEEDTAPKLSIRFFKDGEEDDLVFAERVLEDEDNAVKYDGKVASVFVLRGPIFMEAPGLYKCELALDDKPVRVLAFEALPGDES